MCSTARYRIFWLDVPQSLFSKRYDDNYSTETSPTTPYVTIPLNPQHHSGVPLSLSLSKLSRLSQLLNLTLPIIPRLKSKNLPRLLDTNQPFSRIIRLGRVRHVGEDFINELLSGLPRITDIGIGDVEDVGAL